MKKLFFMLALASLTTGAYASKARLEAFGEDKYGSFVFDDYRNIYLNMAAINDYKNFSTIEWGSAANGSDSNTAPSAEGGMTFASGNMVYGIHMGYASDTITDLRTNVLGAAPSAIAGDLSANDVVDLMIGSQMGDMKWGAALQYSSSKDETQTNGTAEQSAAALRLGMYKKALRVGAIISLKNSVKYNDTASTNVEFKGKLGLDFNGSYDLANDFRVFGRYQTIEVEGLGTGTYTLSNLKVNKMELGTSKMYNFSKTNFMFAKIAVKFDKTTPKSKALGTEYEEKNTYIPVTLGAEGMAKEWLKLRGSISMNLYGKNDVSGDATLLAALSKAAGKKTIVGTANINAGATLVFGNLEIDGLIGTTGAAGATAEDGRLALDTVLTRVAMTYNF